MICGFLTLLLVLHARLVRSSTINDAQSPASLCALYALVVETTRVAKNGARAFFTVKRARALTLIVAAIGFRLRPFPQTSPFHGGRSDGV
jgi:hypothetical protein